MKRSSKFVALLLAILGSAAVGSAGAQELPLLFDASAYGKANLGPSESTGNSAAMVAQQNAAFEPMHELHPSNRFRRLSDSIGRIDILVERDDGRSGVMTCTGALLEGGTVLTNSHCVPSGSNLRIKAMSILMNYLKLDDEGERFKIVLPALERNTALDYAILGLSGNPAAKYGHVRMVVTAAEPGQSLILFHHPGGKPKVMTRFRCIAHTAQTPGPQLRHRCDTQHGSSGALVFNDQLEVAGLHYLGGLDPRDQASFNTASRMGHVVDASKLLREIALQPGSAAPVASGAGRATAAKPDETAPEPAGRSSQGLSSGEISKILRGN